MLERDRKSIGGYFAAETFRAFEPYHETVALKSGRACVRFLIEQLQPKVAFIPYYCCHSLLSPFLKLGIPLQRYCVNDQFEITEKLDVCPKSCLVYINYFGLKTAYVHTLVNEFGPSVWTDNTQAFFEKPVDEFIAFNSARKFFGVADGAYLYGPKNVIEESNELPRATASHLDHLYLRLFGDAQSGNDAFRKAELSIDDEPEKTSYYSRALLNQIDYQRVISVRRRNFSYLAAHLNESNILAGLTNGVSDLVPFAFPYLPTKRIRHEQLWEQDIFTPLLWPECNQSLGKNCFAIARHREILPLPIDHRYSISDMDLIVSAINQF